MGTLLKIYNWLKTIPWYYYVIVFLLIFGLYYMYRDYKASRSYIPVVVHLKDSVYENKKGEIYKAELAAILKAKDLKKQYKELYDEYKKIKNDKPLVITNTVIETRIDSVYVPTLVTNSPNGYTFDWNYRKEFDKNNFVSIEGQTKADSILQAANTLIKSLRLGSDLVLDVISNPDYPSTLEVIARSNNPYVSIMSTQGAIIDPLKNPAIKAIMKKNQKTWAIGLNVGFGGMYGLDDNKLHYGPTFSIGVTKTILTF